MGFDQGLGKWIVALNIERKGSGERGEGARRNVAWESFVKAFVSVVVSLWHMIEQVMGVTVWESLLHLQLDFEMIER